MKKVTLLFWLLMTVLGKVYSQDTTWLKGKLVDTDNLSPISHATVRVGTVYSYTDKLGVFSIQFIADSLRQHGMDIEATGFRKLHLSEVNDSTFLYLTLSPINSTLEGVSVRFGGKDIIRRVYENIPKNYPTQPFNQFVIQFTQMHIDDTAYMLNDLAKVKFYISNYGQKKNAYQTQLLQNRQTVKDFADEMKEKKENLKWPLSNPYVLFLNGDIVLLQNAVLDTSAWDNYSYKLLSKQRFKNRTVYPVAYKAIDSTKIGTEGIVLIDSATYAVCQVIRHANWAQRQSLAKRNKGSDFFRGDEANYEYDGKQWKLKSLHTEGYIVRKFKNKNRQADFIVDAIAYPENNSSVEKIPLLKRAPKDKHLDSFHKSGTKESWKRIMDFIHTDDFQSQYPWLSKLGW
ncbi:MAG: hypothetical protein QM610_03065 [Chitinophagaceae bacterium]